VADRLDVVDVEIDRDDHVSLSFADGYEANFPLLPLRAACPCAGCRGLREQGRPVLAAGSRPPTILSARLVGNWGLGIDWSDGHQTGIYSWEVLRDWSERDAGQPGFN
jgi:DUF971 family protein